MKSDRKAVRRERREFSPEFKAEAVRIVAERRAMGVSLSQVGRELDVRPVSSRTGHPVAGVMACILMLACAGDSEINTASFTTGTTEGCEACVISVERVATLTGGRGGLEGDPRSAVIMQDGRLLFVGWTDNRPAFVADIERNAVHPIMPVGDGPGEIRYGIAVHRSWSDTLFMFDDMNRRMTVLSPSGSYVDAFRVNMSSFAPDFVQLRNGQFAVAATASGRERTGQPLHLLDRSGSFLRSFGTTDAVTGISGADESYRLERRLAIGSDSTFLSVSTGSYVIERWSMAGDRIGAWDVAPDWFTPKDRTMPASHEEAPPPRVMGIQEDAAGQVWTLVRRAGVNWQTAVRAPRRPPAVMDIVSMEDYVDTVIEVFDGGNMERIATMRFSSPLAGFVAPGVVMASKEAANGEVSVHLLQLRMKLH